MGPPDDEAAAVVVVVIVVDDDGCSETFLSQPTKVSASAPYFHSPEQQINHQDM